MKRKHLQAAHIGLRINLAAKLREWRLSISSQTKFPYTLLISTLALNGAAERRDGAVCTQAVG